jgi:pimeloyl-ACP methyl ester carboxylesterase
VLAIQDIRQDLVLGYSDELKRTDPDEMQARINGTAGWITCNYVAVFGRRLGPVERDDLLARIPGVQMEEWPNSGYFVHLVEADRLANRLRAFIRSCGES